MPTLDLAQIPAAYTAAVNAGDLDALCALYTDDAVFVTGLGQEGVNGIAAIREVLGRYLATRPVMEFEHAYVVLNGDTALARGRWTLTTAGPDGEPSVIAGSSIEILRRQPDGSWRYVIDHPWGAD